MKKKYEQARLEIEYFNALDVMSPSSPNEGNGDGGTLDDVYGNIV